MVSKRADLPGIYIHFIVHEHSFIYQFCSASHYKNLCNCRVFKCKFACKVACKKGETLKHALCIALTISETRKKGHFFSEKNNVPG